MSILKKTVVFPLNILILTGVGTVMVVEGATSMLLTLKEKISN